MKERGRKNVKLWLTTFENTVSDHGQLSGHKYFGETDKEEEISPSILQHHYFPSYRFTDPDSWNSGLKLKLRIESYTGTRLMN